MPRYWQSVKNKSSCCLHKSWEGETMRKSSSRCKMWSICNFLGNLFYGRRKNFKRFARAWTTHRHTAIIIIKSAPTNPQKVVILGLNRNDSKSILIICFGHKTAMANSSDGMNGIFNRIIGYASKFWRNAIIQWGTLRKRKVVNQMEFTLSF